MYVILAYDIKDDKIRDKVRELLRKYLNHVQKSVFEGYIDKKVLDHIVFEVLRMINTDDRILIIILDYKNFKKISLGKKVKENII